MSFIKLRLESMETIKDLDEGMMAIQDGEYAIVKLNMDSPHQKFYANIDENDFEPEELESAIEVTDMFKDHLEAKKTKKWMQKAFNPKNKGKLHERLGISKDKKIPDSKLKAIENAEIGSSAGGIDKVTGHDKKMVGAALRGRKESRRPENFELTELDNDSLPSYFDNNYWDDDDLPSDTCANVYCDNFLTDEQIEKQRQDIRKYGKAKVPLCDNCVRLGNKKKSRKDVYHESRYPGIHKLEPSEYDRMNRKTRPEGGRWGKRARRDITLNNVSEINEAMGGNIDSDIRKYKSALIAKKVKEPEAGKGKMESRNFLEDYHNSRYYLEEISKLVMLQDILDSIFRITGLVFLQTRVDVDRFDDDMKYLPKISKVQGTSWKKFFTSDHRFILYIDDIGAYNYKMIAYGHKMEGTSEDDFASDWEKLVKITDGEQYNRSELRKPHDTLKEVKPGELEKGNLKYKK